MTEKKKMPEPVIDKSRQIEVACREGEDPQLASARMLIGPHITNANVTAYFAKGQVGEMLPLAQLVTALAEGGKRVNSNDMKDVEATLISQATALNVMFGELSRRAALNMGEYLEASERYMRMALKAQNQCRMTLETLSNIKNPPVVYAKQANIANGPQQVNNSELPRAHTVENQNPPNKLLEELEGASPSPSEKTSQDSDELKRSDLNISEDSPGFLAPKKIFAPTSKRFVPSYKPFVPTKIKPFVPTKPRFKVET